MRPITFRVVECWLVHNTPLSVNFSNAQKRLKELGRDASELRLRRGFHGLAVLFIRLALPWF